MHHLELFKAVEKRLPGGWKIHLREEKKGQIYFVILRDEAYFVRTEVPYEGEPHEEEAWAKKNGQKLAYELHLYLEPFPYETYLLTRPQQNINNEPKTTTTTQSELKVGDVQEVITDIENKYGIKEIAFDKDAGTYAAFNKDEKDRLVNYLFAKEYYAGRPQIIQTPTISSNFLYVKDYMVNLKRKYSTDDYRIYPKYITTEAERIEQYIITLLQPK